MTKAKPRAFNRDSQLTELRRVRLARGEKTRQERITLPPAMSAPEDGTAAVAAKLARLRTGGPPRTLDLFTGCGGLSLGFVRAGCRTVGGAELDPAAVASYARNFHQGSAVHRRTRDLADDTLTPEALIAELRDDDEDRVTAALIGQLGDDPMLAIDIIVGGPPCPTFTRVGRAKLREVYDNPQAHLDDPRASLWVHYLRYVQKLAPVAVLMENVPDFLNFGGRNLGEDVAEALARLGYITRYTLLNAAGYGVPQLRERFFLIAIHESADIVPTLPRPTHTGEVPRGYEHARQVALRHVKRPPMAHPLPGLESAHVPTPLPDGLTKPSVTVHDALSDLPRFSGRRWERGRSDPLPARDGQPYAIAPKTDYQRQMRSWPGFEAGDMTADHITRRLTRRDFRLFAAMAPGDEFPRAKQIAQERWRKIVEYLRPRHPHSISELEEQLRQRLVPPYPTDSFPNRWWKLNPERPSRTLMAHLGKDGYTHIHYDSRQARVITVREAARLQSFPDGFRFEGSMNDAYKQIGNAVPPLLAAALAARLLDDLGYVDGAETITEVTVTAG